MTHSLSSLLRHITALTASAMAVALTSLLASCSPGEVVSQSTLPHSPELRPDYAGVTFPPNIAAPSFLICDSVADRIQTEIGRVGHEPAIRLRRSDNRVQGIPLKQWHALLSEAAGDSIYFRIYLHRHNRWCATPDIVCPVDTAPIDPFMVYRVIYPGYELWSEMGIYQRDLTCYDQTPILENRDLDVQCLNCHNFSANDPARAMMLHVRGAQGGTLVSRGGTGTVEKFNSRVTGMDHGATYPCWNPDGRFIAFSANNVIQVFHTAGEKPIEVSDLGSDLMVYDAEQHRAYSDTLVAGTHHMETYPAWSPDGGRIYFCRADGYSEERPFDQMRYDLYRIDFDRATGQFSNLRPVYEATADSLTVTFPRVSPDGRWLMFTRAAYGNFTIWHPEAQLCVLDLQHPDSVREMDEVNSASIESYHSFSSSGRWFVFSSKRMDGLCSRPFIAAFDPATGRATKPFPMPQDRADFYDNFTRTYNIPELTVRPVDYTEALFTGVTEQSARPVAVTFSR